VAVSAFAEACHHPFSNGTEADAWDSCWCAYCVRDHANHKDGSEGEYCSMWMAAYAGEWPEGWIPEPDDGEVFLPSRMICTAFTPCEACDGDPGPDDRAERVAEVTAYWKDREK
jgi:hypothetical protein